MGPPGARLRLPLDERQPGVRRQRDQDIEDKALLRLHFIDGEAEPIDRDALREQCLPQPFIARGELGAHLRGQRDHIEAKLRHRIVVHLIPQQKREAPPRSLPKIVNPNRSSCLSRPALANGQAERDQAHAGHRDRPLAPA